MNLSAIQADLEDRPTAFDFLQAVRLIEALFPERSGVGGFAAPGEESVRFSSHPSVAFPPSEIESLELDPDGPARMAVNFMGLVGPQGVLPLDYTLLVEERVQARDSAMRDFLDIFQHRLVSLFFRAWMKHQFLAQREKGEPDRLTEHLFDLTGLGMPSQQTLSGLDAEVLPGYAGLLAAQPRSALALKQLLEDYFQVPAEIEQFVGDWYALRTPDQCEVGDEERMSSQLGLGAVAGDEVWDPQARVRVRLGPLARVQYDRFLPDGDAHESLRALLRFFSHDQFEFEVQLVLEGNDVPGLRLGTDEARPLGWTTWLRTRPPAQPADQTILRI